MSIDVPPKKCELRIFNQIMETFTVNELAMKIKSVGDQLGFNVKTQNIENPRKEKEMHYYNPKYQGLIDIGVKPHYLDSNAIRDLFKTVEKYKDKINESLIYPRVKW
jgi:UDP-sulfoquinovose synthase